MRICFRGNHQADLAPDARASTEAHLVGSLRLLGHEVVENHEQTDDWLSTVRQAESCDLFMWTSTWDYAARWSLTDAYRSIAYLNGRMPTVAVHLDRWGGLNREWQVMDERRGNAMFRCRWVFTADGDSDRVWKRANVNHFWLPPGVYAPDVYEGTYRDEYASDVAFVGSWISYAHAEHWPYRKAMLDKLRDRYGDRFRCWPAQGEPAVRGRDLNDLYASVKVVAGDSCLAHLPTTVSYFSDRVTETIGRGAAIVHPEVSGLMELIPEGMGVGYYPKGDWDAMVERIDWWLAHDTERVEARRKGQDLVRREHTYTRRMETVLTTLEAEGAFR